METPVTVVILAAGLGMRMKSRRAKVLHRAGGKTLVQHVVDTALELTPPERVFGWSFQRPAADRRGRGSRVAKGTAAEGTAADEFVNLQTWGYAHHDHGAVWRSFLTEQRALLWELDELAASLPEVTQPVLLMADAHDMIIPVRATHRLAAALPDARVELLNGPGHHLPSRAAPRIAGAIVAFLDTLDDQAAA